MPIRLYFFSAAWSSPYVLLNVEIPKKSPGSCHFQKSPWVFFRCRAYTLPLNLGDTYLSEEQPDPKGELLRVSINPHPSYPIPQGGCLPPVWGLLWPSPPPMHHPLETQYDSAVDDLLSFHLGNLSTKPSTGSSN